MATVLGNMTLNTLIEPAPPYDAEIEYLESTGTQYIDTGVVPQDTTRIDCVYECIGTPPSDWWAVWGCEINSGGWKNFHLRWQASASATHIHLRAGTSSVALGNEIDVKNDTSLFWKSELSKGVHNGVEHAMTYSSVSMISYSIYLFAQHDSSGATKKGKCRIYKLNIYGEDGLIRSFVPVRVGTTGYLYDKVTKTLFGNAGTGDFVCGNDIDVHNALVTANTNFDNIKHWFTDANFSYNPTITFNSGWSASTTITITVINGRIGVVGGNLKCTSALAAGTSYAPFSKFTHPSGISISSGNGVPATNRCWIYFNNASTAIIPEATVNANTNIYFRGVVPLEINPITAKSYVKHIAPLF